MSYIVLAIYHVLAQIPGLAARTHLPCGRMGRRLQAITSVAGTVFMAGGVMCARAAYRGFTDGMFGYFLAGVVGIVAVFLLIGGLLAIVHAIKNPAPPTTANVIPFHRPAQYPARDLHRYRRWEPES